MWRAHREPRSEPTSPDPGPNFAVHSSMTIRPDLMAHGRITTLALLALRHVRLTYRVPKFRISDFRCVLHLEATTDCVDAAIARDFVGMKRDGGCFSHRPVFLHHRRAGLSQARGVVYDRGGRSKSLPVSKVRR